MSVSAKADKARTRRPARVFKLLAAFPILFCVAFGFAGGASAYVRTVTFCNATADAVVVAWAYDRADADHTTSEGWTKLTACSCRGLFSEDVRATEFYVLVAESGSFKKSGE